MENNSVGISLEEMQKFYELVDKVAPCTCTVFSEEGNLEKIKKWLDSDRLKTVTFVEIPKSFKIGDNKVFLIPTIDKPIKILYEDKKYE